MIRVEELVVPIEPLIARYGSYGKTGLACGVKRESVYKARKRGGLLLDTAARWCEHAGIHPTEVWDDWIERASADQTCRGCGQQFPSTRPVRWYCTPRCAANASDRRRYARRRAERSAA